MNLGSGMNYLVGVMIRFNTNGGAQMHRIAAQAQAAEAKVGKLSAAATKLGGAARAAGAGFTALGVAAGAALALGLRGAADLQDAMNQVQLASKMSGREMEKFHGTAIKMSQSTAQSVTQSMSLLQVLATSGINKPKELEAMALPIARFADTQYLGKHHINFDTSAAQAAKVAHMLNLRTAAQISPALDQLYRMSNDMPDSLGQAMTQLKYFAPSYSSAGVSTNEILNLQATADRLGLGSGRGGTGLGRLYLDVLKPSGPMAKAQKSAGLLDASGRSVFLNKQGVFDPLAVFSTYNKGRGASSDKAAFDQKWARGFNTNSLQILKAFGSDAGIAQYKAVIEQQKGMAGVTQAQEKLMSSLNSQTKLLITNFQTLATETVFPWLDDITKPVAWLAQKTGGAGNWMNTHPANAKIIAAAATVVAGAAGLNLLKSGAQVGMHMGMEGKGISFFSKLPGFGEIMKGVGSFFMSIVRFAKPAMPWIAMIAPKLEWLGLRGIPIIGELMLAFDAIRYLPKIAKIVADWWTSNQAQIGYTVGFAFGALSKLLLDNIRTMYNAVAGALRNPKTILDILNNNASGLLSDYSDAYSAQQRAANGSGGSWMRTGFGDAMGGGKFAMPVTVSNNPGVVVHNLSLHLPNVKTKDDAMQIFDIVRGVADHARSGSAAPHDSALFPRLSAGAGPGAH